MILSMTGFGRGAARSGEQTVTVEIKSLNSKQLDISLRAPGAFREGEITMRAQMARTMLRGKVEASVSIEDCGQSAPARVNIAVAKDYKQQIALMASELQIPLPDDWYATLMRLPETLTSHASHADAGQLEALQQATAAALESLVEFRTREGEKLALFFEEKIEDISCLLSQVEPFEKERISRIRGRLEENLARLEGMEYDRGRLEQELIFYIEKLDVTEEKTRLRAHLAYFLETLRAPVPGQGKKLGFIAQEMGREINTLGSKSNNADMQRIVVLMKDALEQIKEQVLNVL